MSANNGHKCTIFGIQQGKNIFLLIYIVHRFMTPDDDREIDKR